MDKELSVLIPAYNEEAAIAATLEEVTAYFKEKKYRFEVIVIDDGSKDSTARIVESAAGRHPEIRLVRQIPNGGKGVAVKRGVAEARFKYCLFMDADNATRIAEWDQFEAQFQKGERVVTASRHIAGSRIVHPQPVMRRLLGSGYRVICRILFGLKASDFNCGFKAYETAVAKQVYSQITMTDWTFDVEVFCYLKRLGIRHAEAPVEWCHKDKSSGLPPVKTALRSLGSLRKLRQKF